MGENSTALSDLKTKVLLAKLLLTKYNVLHSFHQNQLEYYIIACCNISIDGKVSVAPEKKSVSFDIQTEKFYYKKNKQTKKLSKIAAYFSVMPWKYKKELKLIHSSLNDWCKELLWGENTNVNITVDGVRIYGE